VSGIDPKYRARLKSLINEQKRRERMQDSAILYGIQKRRREGNFVEAEHEFRFTRAQAVSMLQLCLDTGNGLAYAITDEDNYGALTVEVRKAGRTVARYKLGRGGGYEPLPKASGPLDATRDQDTEV